MATARPGAHPGRAQRAAQSPGIATGAPPVIRLLRSVLLARSAGEPIPTDLLAQRLPELLACPHWRVFAPMVETAIARGRDPEPGIPGGLLAELRRVVRQINAGWMHQEEVILALGERLSASGLAVLLLKASALTGWVYPSDAPRLGADIDLLIRPADLDRFAAAIADLASEDPRFETRPHLRRLAYERSFWTTGPLPVELDVHLAPCYPDLYPIDDRALWERSHPHPSHGTEGLRRPCPEDMLIHLAIHALHDLRGWSRHDVDAALVIQSMEIDWDRLVSNAQAWGATVALYLLLWRTRHGLGVAIPARVLDSMRPGAARRLIAGWVLTARPDDVGRLRQLAYQLVLTRGIRHTLGFQMRYLDARLRDALVARFGLRSGGRNPARGRRAPVDPEPRMGGVLDPAQVASGDAGGPL